MKTKHMRGPLAAILLYTCAILAAAASESQLLVSSKCKLLEVTSRTFFTQLPNGVTVERIARDIKIIVPLRSRVNISDPTSPIRTKFVYKISDFCKNCARKASPQEPQCNPKPPPIDECYAHDNKTCLDYQSRLQAAILKPEHQHQTNHWVKKPTMAPVETTRDLSSISDAP
ncbi:immunoglobulin J chain-like [Cetorhinus maximus]